MKLFSGLAAVALAATTIAQPLLVPANAATPAQAAFSAGDWLAGEVPVALAAGDFTYYPGQLIDAGLALQATNHADDAGDVSDDLAPLLVSTDEYDYGYAKATEYDFDTHANLGVAKYANATAKAAAFTERIGRDASTEYADIDLVAQLEELTNDTTGRMADVSTFGNYANTIGQGFAVEALAAAGSSETAAATEALLAQQCPAGFFPLGVDGTCPATETSPDVTALVVTSLVESGLTTAEVTTAIADAAVWLESIQLADGSFPGGAAGANTNGTGLAGWALGAAGRTQSAAKAGSWVRGLQVSDAGACATLAPTGAIAYNAADLAAGRTAGIASKRSTWRIAASQAAPALNWAPAASAPLGISTPATASDAGTVTATVTGLAAGEYGCVTLGTTARSIKGTGGVVTTDFQLPAGAGAYVFAVTTLTGSQTSTTTVPAPTTPTTTPTATPTTPPATAPAPLRGSVTGVRLVGPVGFQRAGRPVALEVLGARPGARYLLRGPGVSDDTLVVAADGTLSRTVTLPEATTTASYVLFGADGQVADDTRVLGRTSLKVSALNADGPRTRVLVRRLAPGEKVRLVVAGETLARGRANDAGRFVARIELPDGQDKVRLRAVGQFPALRSGATTIAP
ncbi:hypothetical protein [Nocardioides zhouii]|uniref:Terpene cyclase/mutase family protein n=1 Tax=Nocardioides zhouii TaxID=1168729 RepID=A0A4Q2T4S0_9ACTN|nr:hypothetical protein [Nocardioides zhouii]RYC12983.1 hypothetical protein EUA94_07085 [Nocardioides zhouii]